MTEPTTPTTKPTTEQSSILPPTSVTETLTKLEKEFPNLKWEGHGKNQDHNHVFIAKFGNQWELEIDVYSIGCMGILTAGCQQVIRTRNERGITLDEVLAYLRKRWDEIEGFMSQKPKKLEKSINKGVFE